jgi:lipoate-protein ligase A
VNARGKTKLIGAAQRIVRGAWLVSTVVVVDSGSRIKAVLEDVYAELGLEWDPATTGAVADEVPGVSVEDVRGAILAEYAERATLIRRPLAAEELAAANALVGRYRV